ncbi:wax ester/triacylglycerol synthase family O-acyltransferase [uncultured Jatrophihabitans sp.]|uniref:wax ester/triacylglycerol synthase family O-acyltransferase n=1 Tax=uncultured Jatrophihabitans sp. TaxID=1610747 RepID=UPI0035CB9677
MTAVDAAWLHMDRPVNALVVNAVLLFDDRLDDELLRVAVIERLLAHHDRFAQRVQDRGTRRPWWVDVPDFDPMSHVTRERLPAPADHDTLMQRVSELASTPLPDDRPLWQLHVLDGYRGGTAIVARMHHCIADGVALFRVLLSLSDEAQDGGLGAPFPSTPTVPAGGVRRVVDTAVAAGKVVQATATLLALPPDRKTQLRAPVGVAKSLRWSAPIPVPALKAAAKATEATINDLVLAALSGALRRQLGTEHDVRAVLPVNLRPLDRPEVELGNRFGLVFLRLPVSVSSSARRIALVCRRTAALKRSATAPVALAILALVGHLPRRAVSLVIDIFSVKSSLVVTNVPGPREPLHLGGCRLTGIIAWPPQSGRLAVGVSVISYNGQVLLGVMADDQVLPDPDALLAHLRDELEALGVRTDD